MDLNVCCTHTLQSLPNSLFINGWRHFEVWCLVDRFKLELICFGTLDWRWQKTLAKRRLKAKNRASFKGLDLVSIFFQAYLILFLLLCVLDFTFLFSFHCCFSGLAPLWRRLCLVLPRCQKGHPFTFLHYIHQSEYVGNSAQRRVLQKYITVEGRFWSRF